MLKWFFGNFNFKTTSNGKIMPEKFLSTKSWKNHPKKLHTYGRLVLFSELHFRVINSFIQPSLLESLRKESQETSYPVTCPLNPICITPFLPKNPLLNWDDVSKKRTNKLAIDISNKPMRDLWNSLRWCVSMNALILRISCT